MSNENNSDYIPTILLKYTPAEIIELANETKYCTEDKGQCFSQELCPVSHSTACCMHCTLSAHSEASKEDKAFIDENFTCKNPRCFRAIAVLFLGKTLEESKIYKL